MVAGTYAVHDGLMWIVVGLLILGVRLVLSSGIFVWIGTMGVAVGIPILRYLVGVPIEWVLIGGRVLYAFLCRAVYARKP
jgi:membrane protein implicated in regulation of membrane protease activity